MFQHLKSLVAVGGWVLAVTLMVVATTEPAPDLRSWSLLVSLIAWIPTHAMIVGHYICKEHTQLDQRLEDERRRTDDLVQAVAREFAEAELPRLARH